MYFPWDQYLQLARTRLFFGEEILMAVRFFTHGWVAWWKPAASANRNDRKVSIPICICIYNMYTNIIYIYTYIYICTYTYIYISLYIQIHMFFFHFLVRFSISISNRSSFGGWLFGESVAMRGQRVTMSCSATGFPTLKLKVICYVLYMIIYI